MGIGRNIQIARENEGLSQDQLARLCELHPSSISFFETGKRTPVARTIVKLAEAMNVTTDELLGRRDLKIRVIICPHCGGTGRKLNE